jgi:hypothetical protein
MKLSLNTTVQNAETGVEGRCIGPFKRKGEQWWTVYWQDGTTTSEREKDMLGGQEA